MAETTPPTARIAVDAMGGDLGPAEVVAAAALALQETPALLLTLVGREEEIRAALRAARLEAHPAIAVLHASEVVAMEDKPLQALKKKRDASMIRAIELVKAGEAAVAVSTGNTGALMACGTLRLRPMEGVDRPALAPIIPNGRSFFVLIDGGANPEGAPEHLVHNAILGSDYCRAAIGIEQPRVGLLTIGTEEGKGNTLIATTHEHLKRCHEQGLIHYHGPVEGFQLFDDVVDVVVCDGFVGNILLKSCQALVKTVSGTLKRELKANPVRLAGAFLAQGAFAQLKRTFSPDTYGGAPLLGLRGHVIKAHGSANRVAIASAIRIGSRIISTRMDSRIAEHIARANEILHAPA